MELTAEVPVAAPRRSLRLQLAAEARARLEPHPPSDYIPPPEFNEEDAMYSLQLPPGYTMITPGQPQRLFTQVVEGEEIPRWTFQLLRPHIIKFANNKPV